MYLPYPNILVFLSYYNITIQPQLTPNIFSFFIFFVNCNFKQFNCHRSCPSNQQIKSLCNLISFHIKINIICNSNDGRTAHILGQRLCGAVQN